MRKDGEKGPGNKEKHSWPSAAVLNRACDRTSAARCLLALCTLLLTAHMPGMHIALYAQQPTPPPDAHAIAQLVDNHYNRLHSLRANFTESYEGLGMSRTESGTLLLLKPGRMRWDYTIPAGKLFLIDGKFAWFYTRGATQVQRIPANEARRSAFAAALSSRPHPARKGDDRPSPRGRTHGSRRIHADRAAQGAGESGAQHLPRDHARNRRHRGHRDRRNRRRHDALHLHRRRHQRVDSGKYIPLHSARRIPVVDAIPPV